ncbi:MAG TPA: glycoside hydrolase family 16 protein, partial [Blastocatellia bacterium]|nr:glycoside hydrolase family 16 protein [Blastocatellia bacterium]
QSHLGFQYHAILVKKSFRAVATLNELPSVGGEVLAIASVKAGAEPEKKAQAPQPMRSVKFAGREWKVKTSGDRAVGPGPNIFSEREENVNVDAEGKLRLRITYREGKWQCAEVILAEDHGYGTYRFTIDTPPKNVAQSLNAVLGAFTWNSEDAAHNHCEIDFELSPWARRGNKLGQFVIQPYTKPENIVRFDVPETPAPTTHVFTWKPERVECESLKGSGGKQRSFFRHVFTRGVPPETKSTNMRFNLWLIAGKPPTDGKEVEVVISQFDFQPLR